MDSGDKSGRQNSLDHPVKSETESGKTRPNRPNTTKLADLNVANKFSAGSYPEIPEIQWNKSPFTYKR